MKRRVQITINPGLIQLAESMMEEDRFDNFSNFIEVLIREEWKRRQAILREQSGVPPRAQGEGVTLKQMRGASPYSPPSETNNPAGLNEPSFDDAKAKQVAADMSRKAAEKGTQSTPQPPPPHGEAP